MEVFGDFIKIHWWTVFMGIVTALVTFKFLYELFEWVVKKFGIETKREKENREMKQLLKNTSELATKTAKNLDILQNSYEKEEITFHNNLDLFRNSLTSHISESKKDREKLHEEQKNLASSVNNLTKLVIENEIDNMRNQILEFTASLSSGKKYNRESFDHILRTYQKYEKILEENNMENGLIESSVKYIREIYQEHLKNGFINN